MENKIGEVLENAVRDSIFPGAVVGVIEKEESFVIPYGCIDQANTSVTSTTIYDVASVTKAIPTSSLALYFLDQKILKLNDPVRIFLPLFRHRDVTIWHLLTQTLSLKRSANPLILSLLKNSTAEEIIQSIYEAELASVPGIMYAYNNATSILLGKVLEKVGGKSLDKLAYEIFFQPLQMTHSSFTPLSLPEAVIAPSEVDAWRGMEVRGEVHDESAYTLTRDGVVGSAGLFSTAPDLLLFLSMLLHGGYSKGRRYFSEEMVGKMYENQLKEKGIYAGLGWEIHQPQYMGKYMSETMFGKTGFTGCLVLVDIIKQKGMVLLSNYTYPKRKENAQKINQVRRAIADIVFS